MRVGIGYDVHRLVPGLRLVLGGVEVPFGLGLEGHSDADVLAHAVTDAVLGAAGLGDIGELFPNTDPAYAGADSMGFLRHAAALVRERGWRVASVDATVICEAPRLGPYREAMRRNIARALGADAEAVGVKATTNEGLGAIGRGEGIACLAVALLVRDAPGP